MLVNHQYKVISVAVPKTGSTSLHYALQHHLKFQFTAHNKNDAAVYHMTADDIRLIMGDEMFKDYLSVGVVRNPYDRMVSLYHDFKDQRGLIKACSFGDFVRRGLEAHWLSDVHFRPQSFFLSSGDDLSIKKVFHFEQGMESILSSLGTEIGFEFEHVAHARKSKRGQWQDYYDDPTVVAVLNKHYARDFDLFGYDRL